MQPDGLSRLQHHFGRRHLHVRRRAIAFLRGRVHRPSRRRLRGLGSDGVHGVAGHKKDSPARNGRAAQHRLGRSLFLLRAVRADRQLDLAEHLGLVRVRPQDEELPAFSAHVDLAVGQHRRRLLHRSEILLPQLPAAGDIEGPHTRAVLDLIHAIAVDHRRGEAELHPLHGPFRLFDVTGLRSVDRRDHPQLFGVEVLVAVRDDHRIPLDDGAGVDRALRQREAPHLLTGLRFDRLISAVAVSADEQADAVDRRDDRRRICRVVRSSTGRRDVDDVAGSLVERDESQRAVGQRAPVRDGGIDDDQIAIDERRHRPAAVRGEGGEFLTDGSLPEQLAILVQCDDQRADAERVDVARLGIGGGRGPADAMRRHVALEDVELVLPDHVAGIGIERHDPFLHRGTASGRVLHVDPVAHHNRRRPPAVRRAPQEVLAVDRPLVDQTGLHRDAISIRPARFRPVADRDAPGSLRGRQHAHRTEENQEARFLQHRRR